MKRCAGLWGLIVGHSLKVMALERHAFGSKYAPLLWCRRCGRTTYVSIDDPKVVDEFNKIVTGDSESD